MTYVRVGNGSLFSGEGFVICLVILIIVGIISWVAYFLLKAKDKSKPLQTERVKILEKRVQGLVEWYVVEFENGERKNMRNFQATKILIAAGDEGNIGYKGITIQSFQPLSQKK